MATHEFESADRSLFDETPFRLKQTVSAAELEHQDELDQEAVLMERHIAELRMGHSVLELTSV